MSDRIRESIAAFLARSRAQRGWTLRELAERSGLSVAYLSELEHGRKLPTLEALSQLARAYDLPLADVLRALADSLGGEPVPRSPCVDFADLDVEERAELERFAAYLRWRRENSGRDER